MLIGIQYNSSRGGPPFRRMTPSMLNRIALIDAYLRDHGGQVFVYSPGDIDLDAPDVPGYFFEAGEVTETRQPPPRVNGNWTNKTRRMLESGIGYEAFERWIEERRLEVCVPHAFSELVGNKLETYRLIRGFHETLHPHCEPYRHARKQLERFIESGPITFIKPNKGSKGDKILTLRRKEEGLFLTHYQKGKRRTRKVRDAAAAETLIHERIGGRRTHIIQEGVETMRHQGSAFDIRVVMLHDGDSWGWLHEARVSPEGSDVSNVYQGGAITITDELLFDLLGPEQARQASYELKSESFGLAGYLERLHPGRLHEVAFDFVLDSDGQLRLLEINTKPGMSGIGSEVTIFDKRPEHEPLFERWVYPQTRRLARFLLLRHQRLQS